MAEPTATEANAPTIAPEDDNQAKIASLETEIKKVRDEKENYRLAYLKEVERDGISSEEKEEARMKKIALEAVAESQLTAIIKEKDKIIADALKENRELKLAHMSKGGTPPAAIGTHSEGIPVRDTSITQEQLKYFKDTLHWSDKEIERYKANLKKRV